MGSIVRSNSSNPSLARLPWESVPTEVARSQTRRSQSRDDLYADTVLCNKFVARERGFSRTTMPQASPASETSAKPLDLALDLAEMLRLRGDLSASLHTLEAACRSIQGASDYRVQSRCALAAMAVIDQLNEEKSLGALTIRCEIGPTGEPIPIVQAQRLTLLEQAMHAYAAFLQLLAQPDVRHAFVAKNSAATLEEVLGGVAAGFTHACLETEIFCTRIMQVNSNKASAGFVEHMLQKGSLQETDQLVTSFREVQADPFYEEIAAAGAVVSAKAGQNHPVQLVWMNWVMAQKALRQPFLQATLPLIEAAETHQASGDDTVTTR